MYLSENIKEKWQPVMEHPDLPEIKDPHRRDVTRQLLENQEQYLAEAAPANNMGNWARPGATGGVGPGEVATWDPILISLVRRAMPQMIAYDVCGVQPMTGPTGLIFAMRANYDTQGGAEALHSESDTSHSSAGVSSSGAGFHEELDENSNPLLESLINAVNKYMKTSFRKDTLIKNAGRFDRKSFQNKIRSLLTDLN